MQFGFKCNHSTTMCSAIYMKIINQYKMKGSNVSQSLTVLLMCLPQGKGCAMLSVLAVTRQVTSQREETVIYSQNSASYSKESQQEKLSVYVYTSGALEVN